MAQTVAYCPATRAARGRNPPTAEQRGDQSGCRENLFSSWAERDPSTILSPHVILSRAGPRFCPGASNYVWTARSLTDGPRGVPGDRRGRWGGACWAVDPGNAGANLAVRLSTPATVLGPTLGLRAVLRRHGAGAVLRGICRRKMLILRGDLPVPDALLLWGGSFWTPILVLAGLAVGYAALVSVIRPIARQPGPRSSPRPWPRSVWWLWGVGAVDLRAAPDGRPINPDGPPPWPRPRPCRTSCASSSTH